MESDFKFIAVIIMFRVIVGAHGILLCRILVIPIGFLPDADLMYCRCNVRNASHFAPINSSQILYERKQEVKEYEPLAYKIFFNLLFNPF